MRLRTTVMLLMCFGAIALAIASVYSGIFDVAADVPHSTAVYTLLEIIRDRSIAVRAKNIQVPPLADSKLIAGGAKDYAEMCTECHLAPGTQDSEIRQGLYPRPPDLRKRIDASAAEMFWTIKHGIKMSAMPAWGVTHDDQRIWGLVAFLQKLPDLDPQQYESLVGDAGDMHHQGSPHEAGKAEHGSSPQPPRHRTSPGPRP